MRKGQWNMEAKFGKGKILSILGESPGLTIGEIEDEIGEKSTLVGRNVRTLVADGYLHRDYRISDGSIANRVNFIYYLTPEGKIQLEHLTR